MCIRDSRQTTITPRPWAAARSNIGCSEPSPRYGVAVAASATRGLRGSSHVEAYASMVLPISPRLASAMTRSPASRASLISVSSAAMPADPNRSKNATCGFTTGTTPAKASTHRAPNSRTPATSSDKPQASSNDAWGLSDDVAGVREFGARCVDAFAGVVPVVKPQVAFFERFGSAGIAALETLIKDARDAGLLVIADAKRGDIGSTMEAYASTWLDPRSPLVADAATATPYLGLGSLQPMFDLAAAHGRGVIVVC